MAEKFRERLAGLRNELDHCVKSAGKSCVPALLVIGATIPLIAWAILYFSKFGVTMDEDESTGEQVRSTTKLGLWVGGVSIVIWVILYLMTYVPAFQRGLVCMFY